MAIASRSTDAISASFIALVLAFTGKATAAIERDMQRHFLLERIAIPASARRR